MLKTKTKTYTPKAVGFRQIEVKTSNQQIISCK